VKTAPPNTVKFGRTDLTVFPIAFGAWQLGGERDVRHGVDRELALGRSEDAWFDIVPMHKDFRLALEDRDVAAIFEVLEKIKGAPGTRMPMAVAG
jgi:hypothetical protein